MDNRIFDYFNTKLRAPLTRYERGIQFGQWSLLLAALLPVAALFILPAIPDLLLAFALSLISIFWTQYRSICAWIALTVTLPFLVMMIYGVALLVKEQINPHPLFLLPPGPFIFTAHTMPDVGISTTWIKTIGIYSNGKLHALRVVEVDPHPFENMLAHYELCPGDEITTINQTPISSFAHEEEEARLNVIASCSHGAKLTIVRRGSTFELRG